MLRSFSIISKSGILLYSSNFRGNSQNARSIGSLLTALCELSNQSVGSPISYLELEKQAITIVQSEENGLRVVLFHDATYYRVLAKCIALELMKAFSSRFDTRTLSSTDSSIFRRFGSVVGPSIRSASFSLLTVFIEKMRGNTTFAVVFTGGDAIFTYPSTADSLSVAANLQCLEFALQDLADAANDVPSELVVESSSVYSHIMLFGNSTVIVQIKSDFHSKTVVNELKELKEMLALCFQTAEGLMA